MEVDNTIYETNGHTWWDDDAGFEWTSLRYSVNPVRYGYFKRCLAQFALPGNAVLDVGCGGGFLSESFAKDGFAVTGIDPAGNSVKAAGEHARRSGLAIQYHVARAESLPFADAAFDIVACCDVLEHVDSVEQAIGEAARVLKPGGAFLFDTVNRTRRSNLVLIKIWQDWGVGGFSAKHAHVWDKFIRPGELRAAMHARGLAAVEMKGMSPGRNPLAMLHALWKIRRGAIRNGAVATAFPLRESGDLSVSYMGWARKA